MSAPRRIALARSWLGIVAAVVAILCAVWLAAEYAHARYVTPIEKARVDALRLQAKTDAEVQKILKPEWDRQHEELVRRRNAYRWGGLTLLVSIGVFFAWIRWLRPADGQWVGVPPRLRPRSSRRPATGAASPPLPEGAPHRRRRPAPAPLGHRPVAAAGAPAGRRPRARSSPRSTRFSESAGTRRDSILPVLQAIQARYRYLPEAALRRVCEASEITPAQIAGVASFYGQFRLTPAGEHIIRVCEGTACHVSGAVEVRTELRRCLGMADGSRHRSDAARSPSSAWPASAPAAWRRSSPSTTRSTAT